MDIDELERTAENRIHTHRTAEFRLRLRDASGAPVTPARVTLRLQRHEFRLGCNGFLIRGPVEKALLARYEAAFANLLNFATLPFYWGRYEPEPGQEQTEQLQAMADWCSAHGIRTKGHPLTWHEVFPKWAELLPDAEAMRRQRERITRLVAGFRGRVDTWDVFNEATVSARFDNAVGRWVKAKGVVAAVAETLRLAREANPEAELLYNDFNISPAFETLLAELQEQGAPFDVIGIQSHQHKGAWPAEKIWQTCESYARFGLPLHFTELTLLSGRLKAEDDNDWHYRHSDWISTPEGEARQLEEGRRFYTLLFSHPAVEAITWWDFSDHLSWQNAPSGLVRADMSAKPLALWLQEAFKEHWTTRVVLDADPQGQIGLRGFFGSYLVEAEAGGARLRGSCDLSRRGAREMEVTLRAA